MPRRRPRTLQTPAKGVKKRRSSGDARGPVRPLARRRRAAPLAVAPGAKPQVGEPTTSSLERLNKVLATAGFGSRRNCDEMITAGRVEIDRQVVTELGRRVDPSAHDIRVDGTPLRTARRLYFAVHKPQGVLSTNRDPAGRTLVIDLVPAGGQRVYTVGRLDQSSEGLILVTNDGDLAERLAHPRYGVEKTYQVLVVGQPEPEVLSQLRHGIQLAETRVQARRVTIKSQKPQSTVLEIVLTEGRNREIRRMLARTGHKVLRLKRIAIGPLRLGKIPSGASRRLTSQEVDMLRRWRPRESLPVRPKAAKSL